MIRALSMHSWFNTEEENERLRNAKCELKRRKKRRIKKMRRQQEIQNLSSNENFGLNDIINEKKYCNFGNTSAFVSTEGVRQLIAKGATSLIADLVIYKRNNGTLRNTDWLQAKFYRSERKEGGTLVINDDHGKVLFTKQYTFTDLPAGHYTIHIVRDIDENDITRFILCLPNEE